MPSECERTRLIGEIARLLAVECMPEDTRTAALTLIGWLARRMDGECAHALGVEEAISRRGIELAARRAAAARDGGTPPVSSGLDAPLDQDAAPASERPVSSRVVSDRPRRRAV